MYLHRAILRRILRLTFFKRYFSLRHALTASLFLSLFFLLRSLVWLARGLDRLLFPGYRQQPIRRPIYIIGNPRSGTTFTHRLVAMDPRFSYLRLYQTIFPAVTFYKLFAIGAKADRLLGRPLERALNRISRRGFKGWETIHRTGPGEAESDEMFFVYALLSPLLALLFPFLGELEEIRFPDRLPVEKRRRLMRYYRDCLQRHLFAVGPDKILLEKVALIAGRLGSIVETFPDLRIVYLIRHPYESIPSLISMFQVPWRGLAPQALADSRATEELTEMIFEYYRSILRLKKTLPPDQFIELRYTDLVADPRGSIQRLYEKLGLEMDSEFERVLSREAEQARGYRSRHSYSLEQYGLTREKVQQELREVFLEYGFES